MAAKGSLPIFQTESKDLGLLQTTWASQLNPLLSNPVSKGSILTNMVLSSGDNVINHKLGRKLQGYYIVRQRGPASVYDLQDSNPTPALTLVLNSNASVSVDLIVF